MATCTTRRSWSKEKGPTENGYWLLHCTSMYTLKACREIRKRLEAEGKTVRLSYRGKHRDGAGNVSSFAKVYVWCES